MFAYLRAKLTHWYWSRKIGHFGQGAKLIDPVLVYGGQHMHFENGVRIERFARLECVREGDRWGKLFIGEATQTGFFIHIACGESVHIGKHGWIAGGVYITDHDHAWPAKAGLVCDPVHIEEHVWLGERAMVLKGVRLGTGCMVAANAVVTKSAPPYCMLAGMPARIIKRYDLETKEWRSVSPEEDKRLRSERWWQ